MRRVSWVVLTTALMVAACADAPRDGAEAAGVSTPEGDFRYIPEGSDLELGVAGYAKVICSAVFVSGRDPEEARYSSGYFMMPESELPHVSRPVIDREARTLSLSFGDDITRTAVYTGDQGCVLLPAGKTEPVGVTSVLPPAETTPWPMGDVLDDAPFPAEVNAGLVEEALELAFSDPQAYTAAFLVLHRGRIIAERYMPGIDKDTQLIHQGQFGLHDPAPIPSGTTLQTTPVRGFGCRTSCI